MKLVRNGVKAIIIQEGKMLFNKMRESDTGEVYYNLPGGGQQKGETFAQALKRECEEELGAQIKVGELMLIREYIGKNHKLAYKHQGVHLVEFMFSATLSSPLCKEKASEMDDYQDKQEPYRWMTYKEIKEENIYPKALRECFDEDFNLISQLYLGDVN